MVKTEYPYRISSELTVPEHPGEEVDVSKEQWGYEYYDYKSYRDKLLQEVNNWAEEPDVCYDTAFSILFFICITLIGFSFAIFSIVLYLKRRNKLYYGFDVLYTLLFAAAFIK